MPSEDIIEFLEQVNVDLDEAEGDTVKISIIRDQINEKLDDLKAAATPPEADPADVPGHPGVPNANATGTAQGGVV
jgi:hypothetical protein